MSGLADLRLGLRLPAPASRKELEVFASESELA